MTHEERQAKLLDEYLSALQNDKNAVIPNGLEPEIAEFARMFVTEQTTNKPTSATQSRVWDEVQTSMTTSPNHNANYQNMEHYMSDRKQKNKLANRLSGWLPLAATAVVSIIISLGASSILFDNGSNAPQNEEISSVMVSSTTPTPIFTSTAIPTVPPLETATPIPTLLSPTIIRPTLPAIATGNTVSVDSHPYNQLAYTKLVGNNGNFVGNVYLLDVDTGVTTQLTHSDETASVAWRSSDILALQERPRGSIINAFHLNVNSGTIRATDNQQVDVELASYSTNMQRLITPIIDDATWETRGYSVVDISKSDVKTLLVLPTATTLPQWLPDNNTIVYEEDETICVHNIDNNTRECITGRYATLSPNISQPMFAFTTRTDVGFTLCIAMIDNSHIGDVTCYDENPEQIIGLAWRP